MGWVSLGCGHRMARGGFGGRKIGFLSRDLGQTGGLTGKWACGGAKFHPPQCADSARADGDWQDTGIRYFPEEIQMACTPGVPARQWPIPFANQPWGISGSTNSSTARKSRRWDFGLR
jgi:hypothetical protein